MYDAVTGQHIYLSTACLHDEHRLCRRLCKYCATDCLCRCHYPKGSAMSEFVDNPAAPDADNEEPVVEPVQGEPVVEPDEEVDPDGDAPADEATFDPSGLPEGADDETTEEEGADDEGADDDPDNGEDDQPFEAVDGAN